MIPALGGKHNFESCCNAKSWNKCLSGPPVTWISTIFAPLTAPRFAPKTIACAERADKRRLPTDHNANLHQEYAPVDFYALSHDSTHNFEARIAHICIANTTRKICRMHVLMLSSSCKSPISYCMLPFADLQLNAEHELKGGGVPSPEGLQ